MSKVWKLTFVARTILVPRLTELGRNLSTSSSVPLPVNFSRRIRHRDLLVKLSVPIDGDSLCSTLKGLQILPNFVRKCVHTTASSHTTGFAHQRNPTNYVDTSLLKCIKLDSTLSNQQAQSRLYSNIPNKEEENDEDKELTVFQRFKSAYREHGKVLIGVHLVTSAAWYGSFYSASVYGFDIVPYLEQLGASETITKPFAAGGLGDFALAYLMYKVATPARYTVTLGGTNLVIRYFKKTGKISVSQEDSLRNLYADGKAVVQENRDKSNSARKERIDQYFKAARAKRNMKSKS